MINPEAAAVDADLEAQIEQQSQLLSQPGLSRLERYGVWYWIRVLIARRSPARVAQMERERGLA